MDERLVLVTYDISDDRRRVRLHTALLEFGVSVQESVFECSLPPDQLACLRRAIRRIVRPRLDDVRLYHLCVSCADRREALTARPPIPAPDVYLV